MKALFLDRDGVINLDKGYVSKIEDFLWCDDVFKALLGFKKLGFSFFIITNQSGIGRGYYSLAEFESLTKWMLSELEKHEIEIKKVYFCPHSPDENCLCRKPKPGMILEACSEFSIDLNSSIFVGDKQSDIECAKSANVGVSYLLGEKYASLYELFCALNSRI